MVEFTATGDTGRLRVRYQLAAKICQWNLTRSRPTIGPGVTNIGAQVLKADDFWSTQRPMHVELLMAPGVWWCWDVEIDLDTPIELGKHVNMVVVGDPNPTVRDERQ